MITEEQFNKLYDLSLEIEAQYAEQVRLTRLLRRSYWVRYRLGLEMGRRIRVASSSVPRRFTVYDDATGETLGVFAELELPRDIRDIPCQPAASQTATVERNRSVKYRG